MKKRVLALITVYLFLIPAFAIFADAAAKPDNAFFTRHENKCVYLGRSFVANGIDGFVTVKKEPGSAREEVKIKNGETVYLDYSCLYNSEYWGYTSDENGWVKIDNQLFVLYDYISFLEEHQAELYPYSGDYAEIKKTRAAVAWPWPGAESPLWTIEDLDTTNFRVLHAYKDQQSREWGFVTYLYGSPNIWICLSEPLNRAIPVFHPAQEPTVWKPDTEHTDIGKSANSHHGTLGLMILLVTVLFVGTAVLIKILWKPDKNGSGR